jgi:tetratricopeptide (TPR) repeat protein
MCRQFYRAIDSKRPAVWIIILLWLLFPSLVCSQPLNHSSSSLLSPIQRAEFLLKQSLNEEALLLYQSLILKDGANGYAFRGLVRAYKGMSRLDDAESWVETYLAEKPFSSAALYASGYIFFLKEDIKKAEELFKKALELDDTNALALNNLGAVRLSKKSYTQALNLVRKAIQINPKEPMFFMNLETIYKQMGNPSLIITDYNFYLKEKEDPDLIRGYGMAVGRNMRQASFRLYNKGYLEKTILKWIEIEKIYKEIDHQSGLVPVYFSLGILYEEKGEFKNAKNYFDLVLKLNPLHIQAKERLDNIR